VSLAIIRRIKITPSFQTARWFFGDCVLGFPARLILITGLGLGAAALQGFSLILLNAAISGFSRATQVVPFVRGIPADGSISMAIPLLVIALILSVLLAYAQGRQVLRLWESYQVHSVNRIYDAVRSAVARGLAPTVVDEAPTLMVLRASQRLGALTRIVGSSISAGLRFVVFGVVAVMLNPTLTIMLALVAVPSAALALMYFARRASRCARRVAVLSGDAGQELNTLLKRALQGDKTAVMPELGVMASPFTEKVAAVTGRILYVEKAKVTAGLIAMLALGVFIGWELLASSEETVAWSAILVSALSLLLAFKQLVEVSSAISSFGRFYPAMQAQHQLLEILETAISPQDFRNRLERSSLYKAAATDDDLSEELP